MPASEFYECMIYDGIEPIGGRRGDLHAGIVAAAIANFSIHHGANTPIMNPVDFMPRWEQAQEQSPDQQLQMMLALQQIQNIRCAEA